MPKYKVKYVYERWYDLEIDAESEQKARDMFDSAEFTAEPRLVGGEIQDSVQIEELV